jgi:hypothetical protein
MPNRVRQRLISDIEWVIRLSMKPTAPNCIRFTSNRRMV